MTRKKKSAAPKNYVRIIDILTTGSTVQDSKIGMNQTKNLLYFKIPKRNRGQLVFVAIVSNCLRVFGFKTSLLLRLVILPNAWCNAKKAYLFGWFHLYTSWVGTYFGCCIYMFHDLFFMYARALLGLLR